MLLREGSDVVTSILTQPRLGFHKKPCDSHGVSILGRGGAKNPKPSTLNPKPNESLSGP